MVAICTFLTGGGKACLIILSLKCFRYATKKKFTEVTEIWCGGATNDTLYHILMFTLSPFLFLRQWHLLLMIPNKEKIVFSSNFSRGALVPIALKDRHHCPSPFLILYQNFCPSICTMMMMIRLQDT